MFNFIRNCLIAACAMFVFAAPATADEIVNVEYIVKFVKNKWDVDVPYKEEEIHWAANVEYLLKVVDYANGKLNNGQKTNYGESEYATKEVVDTIAANQAIRTLIRKKIDALFTVIPETDGDTFNFKLSATGTFYVDWGDGKVQEINKSDTTSEVISHTYTDGRAASAHKVGMAGVATGYNTANNIGAIAFYNNSTDSTYRIKSIDGCLSCAFPVISTDAGQYPIFHYTFGYNSALTSVPETLFQNITTGGDYMFRYTFSYSGLESVPAKLFSRITTGGDYMFRYTFSYSGLESVPDDLFAGITEGKDYMFYYTFSGCKNLTTVSAKLFNRITGTAERLFSGTFSGSGLEYVPSDLFAGITEIGEDYVFTATFSGCKNLTALGDNWFPNLKKITSDRVFGSFVSGGVETIGDNWFPKLVEGPVGVKEVSGYSTYFYSTFGSMFGANVKRVGGNWFAALKSIDSEYAFAEMFNECTSLESVGDGWFPNLETVSGSDAFYAMFKNTKALKTIPAMFKNIKSGSESMFADTFSGSGLETVPDDLFAGITEGKKYMFSRTFIYCKNLKSLGDNWFPNMEKITDTNVFASFISASGVETIGDNWFPKLNSVVEGLHVSQTYGGYYETGFTGMFTSSASNLKSVGNNWFGGMTTLTKNYAFASMGLENSSVETIGDNWFPNLKTISGSYVFYGIFSNAKTSLTSIGDNWFPNLERISGSYAFANMFYEAKGLTTIGDNWFPKLETISGSRVFNEMCHYCTSLKSIGDNWFPNLETVSGNDAFYEMFYKTSALKTIPPMFKNIKSGSNYMFSETFSYSGLETIPDDLFAGITEGKGYMFYSTFSGCKNLKTVPAKLFNRITGAADYMFYETFYSSGLESVPDDLFAGITVGKRSLFDRTFSNTALESVPGDLFAGITTEVGYCFRETFSGCKNLKTVPAELFSRIQSRADASHSFLSTFKNSGLETLPDNLFAGITSTHAYQFSGTFSGCTNLTTVGNILPNISGSESATMFDSTFSGATALTHTLKVGPDQLELWERWPNSTASHSTYKGDTQLPNYDEIPDAWK